MDEKELQGKYVMVVDDDPDVTRLLQKRLEKLGALVKVCYNGEEASQFLKDFTPDAIVLDVMMPEKDGYKLCREIKADKEREYIHVIMLTAVADHVTSTKYSHDDGKSLEADDFFCKGPDCVDEVVARLIEIYQSR